jgi:ligand-binding sensor domain-containing protein/signal transduction histidine kinase/DNA-binding response OmpR family regulator
MQKLFLLRYFISYFSKKLWLLVYGSLIACTVNAMEIIPTVQFQFEQISSIQGLSNNTVYDIAQDAEGFIWIATREGLNKYDGQVITSYYSNGVSGLPGNFVEMLLLTTKGELIAGTQKGVCIYQKEFDIFLPILWEGRSLGTMLSIVELSNGDLLLSSSEGLFRTNPDLETRKLNDYNLRDLCEYRKGIVWALYNDEILIMNLEGDIIRRHKNDDESTHRFDLSSVNVECLFKDSDGIMWLGTKRDGIGYYDQNSDQFFNLKLQQGVNPVEDNFIRVINEDIYNRLWIGTESGLYIYSKEREEFTFYGQSFIPTEKGLNDKAIYSIFRSNDNLMWIGTYFGGVNYTNLFQNGFGRIYADGGFKALGGNAVSEIIESSDGKIWIATEDGGISILNPENMSFDYLKHKHGETGSLSSNNVHALEEDQYGNIWIGTFLGGLNRYNRNSGKTEYIVLNPSVEEMEENVYSKSLFSIFIDSKRRMWVGSIGGLYCREKEEDNFEMWNPDIFRNNFVYHIEEDYSGVLWVGTYDQGIFRINTDMSVNNFRMGSNHNILSNRIIFILMDGETAIWFGTSEGGLLKYDFSSDNFTSFNEDDGLINNTVYAIAKDKNEKLWLSTNKGISRFDPIEETFLNYSENDGLVGNQFNFKSGLCTSSGTIYFGAVNGLSYFDPSLIGKEEQQPLVHFTDIKIFNNTVRINDGDILSKHINFEDEIRLKYKHKVFSIDFVALNYAAPKNVRYAYYLEGLENQWNYVGNKRSSTYTNLSPGKYIFHLKASNSEQFASASERALSIHILPPFWLSVWGFILYGVFISGSIIMVIRFSIMRQREKMNVRLATMEKEKNEEISKHRLNFFTYISHEFKTPLTLIIATLEDIMNHDDIGPRFRNYGILMRKNAMRLMFLINQLMDFRKIETDHASLRFNKGDIIGFLNSTFMTFRPLMKKQNIKAKFSSNCDSYIVYFDTDKLEKIITNLISNSCKSFKKPGTISVEVQINEKIHTANPSKENDRSGHMTITITDDGPGMPKEKLEQIYKPFVSVDPSDFHSSGIGLSLVNSLVKYLNGQINFNSASGGGTTVVIELPLIHQPVPELIKDETFIESNTSFNPENTSFFLENEEEVNFDLYNGGSVREYELMIVEDNKELVSFLYRHFSSVFKVHIAYDGQEAYEKIKKSQPDLIISDIMMPRMDGFTLCHAIKNSDDTNHIPVILLTSNTHNEARVEGLDKGADAYVGKPFNLKELDLRVRNLLRARENIRKHFASLGSVAEIIGNQGNRDQMLIKSLSKAVYKHLDNGSFDVETFCMEVNLSKTLLHMKLKKITGLSTTGFIKNIRFNEARRMLQEEDLTIAEIAYRVGYNDPAYFSKSFKKYFGITPSEVQSK